MKQTVYKRTATAYLNKVQSPALLADAEEREKELELHKEIQRILKEDVNTVYDALIASDYIEEMAEA